MYFLSEIRKSRKSIRFHDYEREVRHGKIDPVPLFVAKTGESSSALRPSSAKHMVSAQKAKSGGNNNDHIFRDQHTDHHTDSNAKKHQTQKSSHNPNLILRAYNLICRKPFGNTDFCIWFMLLRSRPWYCCLQLYHLCRIHLQNGLQNPEPYPELW